MERPEQTADRNRRFYRRRTHADGGTPERHEDTPKTPTDDLADIKVVNQTANYHRVRKNPRHQLTCHLINTHMFQTFDSNNKLNLSLRTAGISFLDTYDITVPSEVKSLLEKAITQYHILTNKEAYLVRNNEKATKVLMLPRASKDCGLADKINRATIISNNLEETSTGFVSKLYNTPLGRVLKFTGYEPQNLTVSPVNSSEVLEMTRNGTLSQENIESYTLNSTEPSRFR